MTSESILPSLSKPFGSVRTADGIRLRYGIWATDRPDCRGTVLLAGGRSEFIEKYFETIEELLERGYQVFSFDWRGQGLSERLLTKGEKGFIQNYGQYMLDLDTVLEQLVYPLCKPPLIILAHSMGGHIVLRYVKSSEHRIDKLVLTAPMINIYTDPVPSNLVRRLSDIMVRLGFSRHSIAGSGRHNPFREPFAQNRLTSDAARFARTIQQVKENPDLSAATLTYGWVAATYDSIDILKENGCGNTIHMPVLITVAGRDRVVRNDDIVRFAQMIEHCSLVTIAEAKHEILQEQDSLRSQFWRAFDQFVADDGRNQKL